MTASDRPGTSSRGRAARRGGGTTDHDSATFVSPPMRARSEGGGEDTPGARWLLPYVRRERWPCKQETGTGKAYPVEEAGNWKILQSVYLFQWRQEHAGLLFAERRCPLAREAERAGERALDDILGMVMDAGPLVLPRRESASRKCQLPAAARRPG